MMMNREAREELYDPKKYYGEHYPRYAKVPIEVSYIKGGKKVYYQVLDPMFKRRIGLDVVKSLMKEGRAHFIDEPTQGMGELYADPKRAHKGSWLDFVKAHSNMRTAKGLLDLKAISKLWHKDKPLDLKIKMSKQKSIRLAKHLRKEHPSTKGKMKVFDNYGKPKSGDLLLKDGMIVQRILPGIEGHKTMMRKDRKEGFQISNPADIYRYVKSMQDYDREVAKVLYLDTKNKIIGEENISIGSLNAAVTHPREIFKGAILNNANGMIFIHNHPSGDPTPSKEDKEIARRIIEIGKLIGINAVDSLIVGRENYYSMRESGELAFDPAPKKCEPSICAALEKKGIDCDSVDVPALIDSTLSCDENKKNILKEVGAKKTDKYSKYAAQARQHYTGRGKLINASPHERAAAFAQMRQDGTLRGYDPKPPKSWFAAMYTGIKNRSDVRNPGAIVKNIWAKLTPQKRAIINAQAKKGHKFKYDLPLPDDRATRGTGTLRMVKPFKLAEVQVNLKLSDYLAALKSGLFSKMKRNDGTVALVARCKSQNKNCNIFVDKVT